MVDNIRKVSTIKVIKMQESIPKRFWEEDEWAMEHYKELQEKYPDEWVLIKNNKVIKHGKDLDQSSEDYGIFVSSGAEIL